VPEADADAVPVLPLSEATSESNEADVEGDALDAALGATAAALPV
jgi:hypothetical protein